jgi:hypothetical protein
MIAIANHHAKLPPTPSLCYCTAAKARGFYRAASMHVMVTDLPAMQVVIMPARGV